MKCDEKGDDCFFVACSMGGCTLRHIAERGELHLSAERRLCAERRGHKFATLAHPQSVHGDTVMKRVLDAAQLSVEEDDEESIAVPEGYEELARIFGDAIDQAAFGKGKKKHANGEPWHTQRMLRIGRQAGIGGCMQQVLKKVEEAAQMARSGDYGNDAVKSELLGALVYLAGMVKLVEEGEV